MSTETTQVTDIIGGAVVYWNLTNDFDAEKLERGFDSLGLAKFCPSARTRAAALKHGLLIACNECKMENTLVRALQNPDEDGFIVVREQRGDTNNEYDTLYHAYYSDVSGYVITPSGSDFAHAAENAYHRSRRNVSAAAVSKALVNLASELSGTPLRPSGAIYWLPQDQLARWNAIVQAVENAGYGETKVYQIKTIFDDAAIMALRDAVSHAISQDARALANYSDKPGVGEKFYESRKAEAAALREKVKRWENTLNLTLSDLHKTVDLCEEHVVEASLAGLPNVFGDDLFTPAAPPVELAEF